MTEPRERANLSSVAPIVAPEDEHARVERMFDAWIDKHGPAALARAAGRWLLERSRGFAGKLALLFAGAGAGVGGTAAMNGDTEADAPGPTSGPSNTGPMPAATEPDPAPALAPAPTPAPAPSTSIDDEPAGASACQQCRDDARIAIELLSAQLAQCGAENIPRPPSPERTKDTSP